MTLTELAATCQKLAWNLREQPPAGMESLAHALHQLRESKRALGDAEKDIEAHLADAMGKEKLHTIAGLGQIERKHSKVSPKWDHDRIRPMLAALSRDERVMDESTGEIEGEAEAAIRVFTDVAAVSYYRLGKLKERGLDPDDYCESDGWRTSIRIHPEAAK